MGDFNQTQQRKLRRGRSAHGHPRRTAAVAGRDFRDDLEFPHEDFPAPTHDEGRLRATPAFHDDLLSPDDALGLYLKQMGSIPMLSRTQETELAERLELARRRYRRAALSCWAVLAHVT